MMKVIYKSFILLLGCFFMLYQVKAQQGSTIADTCSQDYNLSDINQFNRVVKGASNSIAPANIKASGNIKIMASKEKKVVTASKSIHFGPGFSAVSGSNLIAYISPSPCSVPVVTDSVKLKEPLADKYSLAELSVYPNPNNGFFFLKIPVQKRSSLGYSVFVYAADGSIIQKTERFQQDLLGINIQKNARGFYFIKAKNLSTGKDFIKKIVVN